MNKNYLMIGGAVALGLGAYWWFFMRDASAEEGVEAKKTDESTDAKPEDIGRKVEISGKALSGSAISVGQATKISNVKIEDFLKAKKMPVVATVTAKLQEKEIEGYEGFCCA